MDTQSFLITVAQDHGEEVTETLRRFITEQGPNVRQRDILLKLDELVAAQQNTSPHRTFRTSTYPLEPR